MQFLFQCDESAAALLLEGLGKLQYERVAGLIQQVHESMKQQRDAAAKPQEPPQ